MRMPSVYLFTGENTYLLRQEKLSWFSEFQKRHGEQNLLRLDGHGFSFRAFLDEVSVAPFLGSKRLVVVEGIPEWTKEEMVMLPSHVHPDTILLFSDPRPDKRLAVTKELLKIATVKEFSALAPKALEGWIREAAKVHGCAIADNAIIRLLDLVGSDQDTLSSEIEKVTLYAAGREITEEDIEMLVLPTSDQEVWHLTGLLARGQSTDAYLYARKLLTHGENPVGLWNMLLWMLRSLVSVFASVQEGKTQPAKIAAATKVPFPTVSALLPLAKSLDASALQQFLDSMSQREIDLKTGGLRMTSDASEEISSVIDTFILTFPSVQK